MIKSENDLIFYIESDLGCYYNSLQRLIKFFELWVRGDEILPIWKFIYSLRYYEYYLNINDKLSIVGILLKHYWRFKFRHCQLNYDLHIEPNVVGYGCKIVHPGFRKIPDFVKIGNNCTILPMVLLGKKKPGIDGNIKIGNDCYISFGVTILGPI